MPKHGAEWHYVRPDAVHRSSILQAIPGYQPVSNAHAVAARFTAAPAFATALQGAGLHGLRGLGEPVSFMDRMKLRWAAFVEKAKAKRTALMIRKAAAANGNGRNGGLPTTVAQLPPGGQTGYGVGPASENMAKVGAQITAGLVRSGDDAMPPGVAKPIMTAGTQIAPEYAMTPGHLAAMVQAGVPSFVGNAAVHAAMGRFNGQRTWWWWNLR